MQNRNIATFLESSYEVSAGLNKEDAALAATHEEVHGIIRRSSFYGLLLDLAKTQLAGNDADKWLHWISSRARTSEEVAATFISITYSQWSGDATSAASALALKAHPEYSYYHKIGTLLTSDILIPFLKSAVIEGLIRFCWCSFHIQNFCAAGKQWTDLANLPPLAFPDNRLQYLKRHWVGASAQKLHCELIAKFSAFIELLQKKSFQEIHDPLGSIIKQEFGDGLHVNTAETDSFFAKKQQAIVTMIGVKTEEIVCFVIDHLSATFRETELAAPNSKETMDFLNGLSRGGSKKTSADLSKEIDIFEVVINRPNKLKVHLVQELDDFGYCKKPIIGVRSWQSFLSNFDVSETTPICCQKGTHPFYGINVQHPRALDNGECDITLEPGTSAQILSSLDRLVAPPALVAIWASLFLNDPEGWVDAFGEALAVDDSHVWIIADVEPIKIIEIVRPLLLEVNAIFFRPLKSKPNMGTLIVRGLENVNPSCPIRGVVFPGQAHTATMILKLMQRQMGDDFRGFGDFPEFENSLVRRNEGEMISRWLMFTERKFSYK